MLLNTLLTIYVCLMGLDILFMISLHFFHDRKGYYKTAAGIWIGLFAAFAMDGLISVKWNGIHHLFGISFANIMSYHFSKLASDIYKLNLPLKAFAKSSFVLWVTALLMHFVLSVGFEPTALVICSGIAAPLLYAAYRISRISTKLNVIDRLFVFLLIVESLHMLDYPFLRNIEGAAVYGFSLGIVLIYFASMLIPVVINRRISNDFNEVLQRKVHEQTDILKLAQEQLVNSSKFAALGEMAAGVAHEINTPLGTIKLRANQLVRLSAKNSVTAEQVHSMAGVIEATADRIGKIVQGLRLFSRNADADPVQQVSVKEIIDDTLNLCGEKFKEAGIDLRIHAISDNTFIDCRAAQISQVLVNLLNNAKDAVENLSEKWIAITFLVAPDSISIHVTDSGTGLPLEVEQKLFQPFFTTKDIGKGTGLGLSISKGIVEKHRGSLTYDRSSRHTSFVVKFPISSGY